LKKDGLRTAESGEWPTSNGEPANKNNLSFNNLQRAALLMSLVQYDKILGQQQLAMVNYACSFNQSDMGKYFE